MALQRIVHLYWEMSWPAPGEQYDLSITWIQSMWWLNITAGDKQTIKKSGAQRGGGIKN